MASCLYAITVLLFIFFVGFIRGADNQSPQVILSESDKNFSESNKNVLLVSTIDGKISAFKSSDGTKMWSVDTEPGSLFSSSLSNLQFLFHGQQTQIIPSLDGYLYKFDGKTLEPLPVSAELLLSTSYRIGDNSNIVGGREVKSYGINLNTGELHYICTSEGCQQISNAMESDDVLVIERHTQTVRAVNFRTGDDMWNYRVGHHRITLSKGLKLKVPSTQKITSIRKDEFCTPQNEKEKEMSSIVKVAMMKGFIGAIDHATNQYRWSQKLSSPIVDVWQLNDDSLRLLDLFEKAGFAQESSSLQPLLLVGAYEKKLYIKQSNQVEAATYVNGVNPNYSINMSYYMPIFPEKTSEPDSTSLVLKYPTPDSEHGFFFMKNNPYVANTTHCFAKKLGKFSTIKETVLSFFQKWKDAIFTSFIVSVFTNIFCYIIWKGFFRRHSNSEVSPQKFQASNTDDTMLLKNENLYVNDNLKKAADIQLRDTSCSTSSTFQSRYLNDFDCIDCLGKGGYGVVFEVKNKIDCCSYAVKRIKFSKVHAFDRVIREVKVLAKLDHIGIVRYYNAWVETPPAEWQDSYDKECEKMMSSSLYSELSESNMESKQSSFNCLKLPDEEIITKEISQEHNADYLSNSWSSGIIFQHSSNASNAEDVGMISEKSDVILRANSQTYDNMSSLSSNQISTKPVKYLFIQMQLCRRESLKDWLHTNCQQRDRFEILNIFYQIVCAVEYVHEQGLMHRDLKPSNIFFSLDGIVKIGDFGLVSSEYDDEGSGGVNNVLNTSASLKHTDEVGTELYMSPEMAQGLDYNHKVDIFSLGLIFYELLVPFQTLFERIKVLTEIKLGKFPQCFRETFTDECKLAAELLRESPDSRPSAAEIREDPIFEVIRKYNLERKKRPRTLSGTAKLSSTEDDEVV